AIINLRSGSSGQLEIEFALEPFDKDLLAFYLHLDFGGDCDRLFSNSRHKFLLPDVTQYFTAQVVLSGLNSGHKTLRGGEDGSAKSCADARDLSCPHIMAQAGRAHTPKAFNHPFFAVVFQLQSDLFGRSFALD